MIISSIGFQGNNIDSSGLLPFDSHDYRIRTDPAGKILGISNGFASGWCAHGPTGVLATTSADAIKVAKSVVNALSNASEKGIRKGGAKEIRKILSCRHVDWISWTDWLRIDETERSRGAVIGKPREKIVDLHEAFDIIQRKKN